MQAITAENEVLRFRNRQLKSEVSELVEKAYRNRIDELEKDLTVENYETVMGVIARYNKIQGR